MKDSQGCIYEIRCKVGKKKGYVGQHKNVLTVERRWASHIKSADKERVYLLSHAIRKYGVENFSAEVVWRGPASELNQKETYYIKKLGTFVDDRRGGGYNLTTGGGQATQFSKQTKLCMSTSAKKRFSCEEERARMAGIAVERFKDPAERKKVSDNSKRQWEDPKARKVRSRISKRLWADKEYRDHQLAILTTRPRIFSIETRRLISEAAKRRVAKGPYFTEAALKKMSAWQKGVPKPAEQVAKQAASMRKRYELYGSLPVSDDTRRKLSENAKRQWANKAIRKKMLEAMASSALQRSS